jgi:L,D-peptidoglycan transpeptidase YkuD (ErfK/YbiS/YcfS/YnhG family)
MKQVVAAIVMVGFTHLANADGPLDHSLQCLVVRTASWSATSGTMSVWQRESETSRWRVRHRNFRVVLGKSGLAWGGGVTYVNPPNEPQKREGDNKAPAGVFRLQSTFGYAPSAETKMPYQQVTPDILCVDDPRSRHYNKLVNQREIDDQDWNSAEQMRRSDLRYKRGVVVDYNPRAQPHAGSCIFLHVWSAPNRPTIGCTAMSEQDIVDIIKWLDSSANPLLVQLPEKIYERYQAEWNLPNFNGPIMLARPGGADSAD